MDANNLITAAVFSALIKCPTKAHLLAIGEPAPGAYFTDIEARISAMYKAEAKRRLNIGIEVAKSLDCGPLSRSSNDATITYYFDCEIALYDFTRPPHRPRERRSQKLKPSETFVPVLFFPWDKLDVSDSLIVCFGALALSHVTGILADTGTLIYGEGHRRKTVKNSDQLARTYHIIEAIAANCHRREPPPLVLNRHCSVCDFQPRCRGLAVERDDLSLLNAMTGKEQTNTIPRDSSL